MLNILLIVVFIEWSFCSHQNLLLINKKRSSFLENYDGYTSLSVSQVEVPEDVEFVSFKISAESFDLSIFGCSPAEVEIYVKKGSLPFLNPDDARNPPVVQNISVSEIHSKKILTDNKYGYINITAPEAGIYYFAAFFPYVDPQSMGVKQKGLSSQCTAFLNLLVYISKLPQIPVISETQDYSIKATSNTSYYNQMFMEPNIRKVVLSIKIAKNTNTTTKGVIRLNFNSVPSKNKYIESKTIKVGNEISDIPFWINKPGRYYLEYNMEENNLLQISIRTIGLDEILRINDVGENLDNKLDDIPYRSAVIDSYYNKASNLSEPYLYYDLIKELGSEAFMYTFNINQEKDDEFMVPVPLNLTNEAFSVLKFHLQDVVDVGGTFDFSIDNDIQVDENGKVIFTPESADQIIIGCISQNGFEVPVLPRHCLKNGVKTLAPVVLNSTINNSTVLIPYPEAGTWYATLRLFCQPCRDCGCYRNCSQSLRRCVSKCSCESQRRCRKCLGDCKTALNEDFKCRNCNCDDRCSSSGGSCDSTIMFDLSSFPCFLGKCGPNGQCQFVVADGYIYSACKCRNDYMGLDCTDNTHAIPFWKLVLGQVLLIVSNIIMIGPCYLAWKRSYYSEAVIYASVLLFSSFYHACDVSDYIIKFCITSHQSLQFGDFFSAQFAVWSTMVAIADVQPKYRAVLQTIAAILVAYFTVIDKKAIWLFLSIILPGIGIIVVSWYFKYKKYGKNFIRRRYLLIYFTFGTTVMVIGVLIYAFFQTRGNYIYLHSIWHCIVGIAVILLLPKKNTFSGIPDL